MTDIERLRLIFKGLQAMEKIIPPLPLQDDMALRQYLDKARLTVQNAASAKGDKDAQKWHLLPKE